MQPSDFTNENRCLIFDSDEKQFCWCSRNEHSHPRKRLTRISPYFGTEEEAVNWIQLHFIHQQERVNATEDKVDNVVPLFDSLRPLYRK